MTRPSAGLPPPSMPSRPEGGRDGTITGLRDRTLDGSGHEPVADDDIGGFAGDIVDEWGQQSFPASDPPANW